MKPGQTVEKWKGLNTFWSIFLFSSYGTLLVFFFSSSFVPLGSSGFAERTRPGQSTTETLRMHSRVFSSTLQRLREKLMLTVHGYSFIPLVPHQRLSAQVATVCVLFHTNWCMGIQTELTGLERRQHVTWMYTPSIRCGNVSLWSSKLFHVCPLFSPSLYLFGFILLSPSP